jgi:hypothetical protein
MTAQLAASFISDCACNVADPEETSIINEKTIADFMRVAEQTGILTKELDHPGTLRRARSANVSLVLADFVAKVENRPAPKISQKLIFRRLRHCNTP